MTVHGYLEEDSLMSCFEVPSFMDLKDSDSNLSVIVPRALAGSMESSYE